MEDPLAAAGEAARVLAGATGVGHHDVFVILGSGWGAVADAFDGGTDVAMGDLPGFPPTSVIGHRGILRSVPVGDARVLLALGRVHLYEGHTAASVVHAVRVAAAAGCSTMVVTNAAGAVHDDWPVGRPAVISDHINLTGVSPLTGSADAFVPMVDAYSPRLRALASSVDPTLRDGVYIGLHGPELETPAEIRAARALGADLVGMSTVLEVIAARHAGVEVLGLSLVTNPAAGVGPPASLDIGHILAVAAASAPATAALLRAILERIADGS